MEKLLYMKTHVKNETKSVIMFDVDKRLFPRVVLQPGETLSVNTHLIHNHCKNNGKEWTIRVLINNEFTGIGVKPGHLICLTRLVFRYKCTTEKQISDICMEGTREKSIDRFLRLRWIGHVFGRNTNWEKRDYSRIAVAKRRDMINSVVRLEEDERREVISPERSNEVCRLESLAQHVPQLAENTTNLAQRQLNIRHFWANTRKFGAKEILQGVSCRRQTVSSEGDIDNTIDSVVRPDEEQRRELISTESNDNDVGGVQAINQLVAPLARNDTNLPQRQTAFSGGDICDKTSSVVPPEEEKIKEMSSPLAEVMTTEEQSSYVVPQGSTMATSSVHMHVTHNVTINIPNQLIFVFSLGLIAVFTSMLLSWV